jgi:nitrate reductase gamma subunit
MDRFTYFWCLMTVAGTIFLLGTYKNVFLKLYFITWINQVKEKPEGAEPVKTRPELNTMVSEVLLQDRIKKRSSFLWSRHFMIFSGFMVLFAFDCAYTIFGHYAHHYFGYLFFVDGSGRAFLKFGMEAGGVLLLIGLSIGIIHRVFYSAQERSRIDLKLLILLWVVTVTGFLTEAFRLAATPGDPFAAYSFFAVNIARMLGDIGVPWGVLWGKMWIFHATVTVAFIAYIPFSKLVHIMCAPIGRSVTQNKNYAGLKRQRIAEELL